MCGINGIFNFRSGRPAEEGLLLEMRDTMVHRGPDDGGIHLDGPLGLGHRRLSILDLSPKGRQPMPGPDGVHVVCFNGEIYNYLELKDLHFPGDSSFASNTDTEVLLALYRKFGPACVDHLNGMFAFAVWDARERTLFLARDRLGKKPLYYAFTPDGIAFASEMKALLKAPGVGRGLREENILAYMAFGYVPGERTLFEGIRKLPAGHRMLIRDGKAEISPYWSLAYRPGRDRGEKALVEEFGALLRDSIRLRLRSDVPLGVFLSGGLDSSAVVALLDEGGAKSIKTFSVAFDFGKAFDETEYARIVARRFGTDHHQAYLTPREFRDYIPGYVWHMDEPVCQASAIPLWHIAKVAREHVTVVLSGEGADELLGGYDIYNYMRAIQAYRKVPAPLRRLVSRAVVAPLGNRKLSKYDTLASLPLEKGYFGVDFYGREWLDSVLAPDFRRRFPQDWLEEFAGRFHDPSAGSVLNRMLGFDTRTWLVDNLLMKADKMSMAPSLELRCPFLDYRLVEFCAALPLKYKIRGLDKKHILKRAMRPLLPAEIVDRKKVGFPTPLKIMFQGELSGYAADLLDSDTFRRRGYFDGGLVSRMVSDHRAGRADYHRELWQLLVLEQWFRSNAA